MTEEQKLKQQALEKLRHQAKLKYEQLISIDPRLVEYYDDICKHSEGDEDYHNLYEILGALKLLRILNEYPFDYEMVKDVMFKYEGEWKQEGRMWRHVRGGVKHPGTTGDTYYRLQPFQVFVLVAMFGPKVWINTHTEAGTRELLPTEKEVGGTIWDLRRLCTEFTLYTPRKTAKTQLSAFIQFWFFMNGDQNAECYCCANAADQSKILYSRTYALIHQLDPKEKRIRFTASQVNWKEGQFRSASLTALSAGGKTKDGLFAQLCSADEYGSAEYVNGSSDMGKLVSVVESSMGPRREPMTFISTTAGIIKSGPFMDKLTGIHLLLQKELDEKHDKATDRQMCLLLEPDMWERDQETLLTKLNIRKKINPMLGIVVQHAFYDDEISKARQNPEKMNETVSKLFNVYSLGVVQSWVKPDRIRELQRHRRIDECTADKGWVVYVGMDFSQGNDLHAMTYLAARETDHGTEWFADIDSWINEKTLRESSIGDLYQLWIEKGWLHVSEGEVFQPTLPVKRIRELDEKGVNFIGFGYDSHFSREPVNELKAWLQSIGLNPQDLVICISQTYSSFAPAVDRLTLLLGDMGTMLTFSANPLWPYEFGCVVIDEEPRMGNKKPIKLNPGSDACKVDNIQCLCECYLLEEMFEGQIIK